MSELVARIVAIMSADDAEAVPEALSAAAFLFEKAQPGSQRLSLQEQQDRGWTPVVIAATPTSHDVATLRSALVSFIGKSPPSPHLGSALFALGKLDDRTLIPILTEAMRRTVESDPNALYQAMIALDNLGEEVFSGKESMSSLDIEVNRCLAAVYLSKAGKQS